MPRPDWRSASAYENLHSLDAPGFAWEFLRRNPEFERDRAQLEESNENATAAQLDSFTRRWGCCLPTGRSGQIVQPLWTAASLPSVIPIMPLPAALEDPDRFRRAISLGEALAENGPLWLMRRQGTLFRLHILEALGERTLCVVLPLDQYFDTRVTAAMRLSRGLRGTTPGQNPAHPSPARRERLILALRALDGRLEMATYRDIAQVLFGASRIPERGWKTHDTRDRTVRLVRLGLSLMQGGYRHLLLYPYRGRSDGRNFGRMQKTPSGSPDRG